MSHVSADRRVLRVPEEEEGRHRAGGGGARGGGRGVSHDALRIVAARYLSAQENRVSANAIAARNELPPNGGRGGEGGDDGGGMREVRQLGYARDVAGQRAAARVDQEEWGIESGTQFRAPLQVPEGQHHVHAEIDAVMEGPVRLHITEDTPKRRLGRGTAVGFFEARHTVDEHHMGGREPCEQCRALLWGWETTRTQICCRGGEISLPRLRMPDANSVNAREAAAGRILQRWSQGSREADLMRKYNRQLNCALTLVSRYTSGRNADLNPIRGWNPAFGVSGRLYHRLPALRGVPGGHEYGLHLYMRDGDYIVAGDVAERRLRLMNLDSRRVRPAEINEISFLVTSLEADIRVCSPYVRDFVSACSLEGDIPRANIVIGAQPAQFFNRQRQQAAAGEDVDMEEQPGRGEPAWQRERYLVQPPYHEIGVLIPDGPRTRLDTAVLVEAPGLELQWQNINRCNRAFDPLHFVLLYPQGEDGWYCGYPRRPQQIADAEDGEAEEDNFATCREFYAYRLHDREGERDCQFWAGKLFQEWCCMAYVKIDTARLDFLAQPEQQDMLRSEGLANLRAALRQNAGRDSADGDDDGRSSGASGASNDDGDHEPIGRRIETILPQSYIGGMRNIYKRYRNAMALVTSLGSPSLFITVTCNPNWPEIRNSLKMLPSGRVQQPADRPDLLARVFEGKLRSILREVVQEQLFGRVIGYVGVVEYQKRGLPHCHVLVILEEPERFSTLPNRLQEIDDCVVAEIPRRGELQDLVVEFMVHGDCESNEAAPCRAATGACRHRFPQRFQQRTTRCRRTKKVCYRRRQHGGNGAPAVLHRGNRVIDNRWVVPYSPYLLSKFKCHINVEVVCSPAAGVKYLFDYVYKGEDRARAGFVEADAGNEIRQHENMRYVAAPEACARIFAFEQYLAKPAVYSLPVHLEHQQRVYFRHGQERQAVRRHETTQLTEWLKWNAENCYGRNAHPGIAFQEFPRYYRWDDNDRRWIQRQRREEFPTLGLLQDLNPRAGERYYLKLLLTSVYSRRCRTFAEIRTVGATTYDTYREACVALGLLEGDADKEQAMRSAAEFRRPAALRSLFTVIVLHSRPTNPLALFNNFVGAMGEDYAYVGAEDPDVRLLVLSDIDGMLRLQQQSLEGMDLPVLSPEQRQRVADLRVMVEQRRDEARGVFGGIGLDQPITDAELARRYETLNAEQRHMVDSITAAVDNEGGEGRFFVDAPAGTGKTYCFNYLIDSLKHRGSTVVACATSGIASTLLHGGRTFHSVFRPGLRAEEANDFYIERHSALGEYLRTIDVLLWDEAPQAHVSHLEKLDASLRDVRNNDQPFGGVIVVLAGDFRQTSPIVNRQVEDPVRACLFSANTWGMFTKLRLTENRRLQGEGAEEYLAWLMSIGNGDNVDAADNTANVHIPADLCCPCTPDDIIDFVYNGLQDHKGDSNWLAERAILCPTNKTADRINEAVCAKYYGSAADATWTVMSTDEQSGEDGELYIEPAIMNNMPVTGNIPPHCLKLYKGCIVMLTYNLDASKLLCNGTRIVVEDVLPGNVIRGSIVGWPDSTVFIPRVRLQVDAQNNGGFTWYRTQLPVKLCFAMTINKSQGQSLGRVGVYLDRHVFSHGQLYVAASRVTTRDQIRFALPGYPRNAALNYVELEILIRAGVIERPARGRAAGRRI
eukprot:GHVU01191799.1.p1 GENE.GHVU01191799.1~~GHVU01191799.1.p1  ORF type:complete len:1705 (-),score=120.63 GHVU01191799.1:910-5910(-)